MNSQEKLFCWSI